MVKIIANSCTIKNCDYGFIAGPSANIELNNTKASGLRALVLIHEPNSANIVSPVEKSPSGLGFAEFVHSASAGAVGNILATAATAAAAAAAAAAIKF